MSAQTTIHLSPTLSERARREIHLSPTLSERARREDRERAAKIEQSSPTKHRHSWSVRGEQPDGALRRCTAPDCPSVQRKESGKWRELSLAEREARRAAIEAARADLWGRERAHGGLVPGDRDTEAKRRSMQGWGPYRSETLRADLKRAGLSAEQVHARDFRPITMGRLWIDCGAAVRRWFPQYRSERAQELRGDAALLIVDWAKHGADESIDLGGKDGLPRRADWLDCVRDTDDAPRYVLSRAAWRALHAATKQATGSAAWRRESARSETELSTEPELLDIAAASEQQQRDEGAATRLPDALAPEVISERVTCSLDCARAIVNRAYPHAPLLELAQQWGISLSSAQVAVSRGLRAVRARWGDDAQALLDDLAPVASGYRAACASAAILTLCDYRAGMASESAARAAVLDWRGAHGQLDWRSAAILGAAREQMRRAALLSLPADARRVKREAAAHMAYASERAELIAFYAPRTVHGASRLERARVARGNNQPARSGYVSASSGTDARAILRRAAARRAARERDIEQQPRSAARSRARAQSVLSWISDLEQVADAWRYPVRGETGISRAMDYALTARAERASYALTDGARIHARRAVKRAA